MTHFTPAEERHLYRLAASHVGSKWGIIRLVYVRWADAPHGQAEQVLRAASEATRKKNGKPLVEYDTIRRWMYAVNDVPEKYLLLAVQDELSFEHLERAQWLVRKGWCVDLATPLQWSLDSGISGASDEMVAHFVNREEETEEQRDIRHFRAKVGEVCHFVEGWKAATPRIRKLAAELAEEMEKL